GVARVLTAACPCARTGYVLKVTQVAVAYPPRGVCAHCFEHVLNRDILPAILAGGDSAAIKNQTGNVQPGKRHGSRRNSLVTSDYAHNCVEHLAATNQFNGIGND